MLTVHHLGISQSDRIVWLCEELEIPYEFKKYDRDPVTRLAPPEYKAISPYQTAPVITDGDVVLGESGAIIEYIIDRHGGGRLKVAADQPNFAEYLFWYHFANASMMPTGMTDLILGYIGQGQPPEMLAALRSRGDRAFALVETRLGVSPHFAGEAFTAADIMMLFPLTTMRVFVPRGLSPYPNILAYLQRIGSRTAYQRAMAKADPDLPPMLT